MVTADAGHQEKGSAEADRPAAGICSCESDDPFDFRPSKLVVLVHGTWGRHAAWMHHGAPLPTKLRQLPGVAVTAFCWTGRNRHYDRLEAGASLRARLIALRNRYPDAEVHVVAHSHGGNVAMYALAGEDALDSVSVTTLATPFLSAPLRKLPRAAVGNLVLGPLFLLFAVVAAQTAFTGSSDDALGWWWLLVAAPWLTLLVCWVTAALFIRSRALRTTTYALGAILTVFLLDELLDPSGWLEWVWKVGFILLVSVWGYRRGMTAEVHDLTARVHLSARGGKHVARLISASNPGSDRLLVVRSAGDEASALLGAAHLNAWLWSRALEMLRPRTILRVVLWSFLTGFVAIGIAAGISDAIDPDVFGELLVNWILLVVAVGLAAGPIVISVLVLTGLPFGLDGLFLILHNQVTAESAPPGELTIVQLAADNDQPLSHAVHSHPDAIALVADRIA